MKAYLKNYRQSPRKVRLVADMIRGKDINLALSSLDMLAKRASLPIKKLLSSAISNAVNMGISRDNLFIKEFRVDKGIVMKRMMPAAMGSAHRINKRTSHLSVVLAEKPLKGAKVILKPDSKKKEKAEKTEEKEIKVKSKKVATKATSRKVAKKE